LVSDISWSLLANESNLPKESYDSAVAYQPKLLAYITCFLSPYSGSGNVWKPILS
jgi:hypothetical protein